jgi:hypothetical protein
VIKLFKNETSSFPSLNNNWKSVVTLNPSNVNPFTPAAKVIAAENTASSALSAAASASLTEPTILSAL